MRVFRALSLVGALTLIGCGQGQRPTGENPPNAQPGWIEVETFTGVTTHMVELPGKVDGRGGVVFSGATRWASLRFNPGAVDFGGQSVDFAGKEDDFMTTDYRGDVNVPVIAGANKVKVRGALRAQGYAFPDGQAASSSADGLEIGQSFSPRSISLLQSQKIHVGMTTLNFMSPIMPELQGAMVRLEVDKVMSKVDAATGLVEITMDGKIFAKGR